MTTPTPKPTFSEWMQQVDAIIWRRVGCGADDLADFCYRDWYDEGVSAAATARAAIRDGQAAGF